MVSYLNIFVWKWSKIAKLILPTFVSFIAYSLPYYDFSPKGELIISEDTKSIVMNDFLYTLKFDNSPCEEISTSPTQRCVLQTGRHTSQDSMFRWSKCFKEARTKTVLSSHCTYYMFSKNRPLADSFIESQCLSVCLMSLFMFRVG